MTVEEYFEGLGCSPDEVQVCAAASRARYQREIRSAAATVGRSIRAGFISHGDPDRRVLDRALAEDREVGSR